MNTIAVLELIATLLGGANNLIKIVKTVKADGRDTLTADEEAQVKTHVAPARNYFNGPNFQN